MNKILKQEIVNGNWWAWVAIDADGLNTEILQSKDPLTEQEAEDFLIRRAKSLEEVITPE